MARGTQHILTGTLCWRGRGYALQMDDGGQWRLDIIGSARRYLNQRVTVEGTRSGFNLLDVHRVGPGDTLPPKEENWLLTLFAQALRSAVRRG